MLGQTPLVMQLLGADTVTGKAAATGGIYAAPHLFDGAHPNITPDLLQQIPAAMADPIAIFDSDNPASRAKSDLVFMLGLTDANGATLVVPVVLKATGEIPGSQINIIKSAYAKEREGIPSNTWFAKQLQKNARYMNGHKWKHWTASAGVYFPFTPANASKNKLYTEADLVKPREANPTLYQNGIGANAKQRLEEDAARFAEELDRSAVDAKKDRSSNIRIMRTPFVLHRGEAARPCDYRRKAQSANEGTPRGIAWSSKADTPGHG